MEKESQWLEYTQSKSQKERKANVHLFCGKGHKFFTNLHKAIISTSCHNLLVFNAIEFCNKIDWVLLFSFLFFLFLVMSHQADLVSQSAFHYYLLVWKATIITSKQKAWTHVSQMNNLTVHISFTCNTFGTISHIYNMFLSCKGIWSVYVVVICEGAVPFCPLIEWVVGGGDISDD